jgi:CRP-like cAMP-binding protein
MDIKDHFIQSIAVKLIPQIFLPGSYIIYKGDIGNEMFFIIEGSVNVLSPD